MRGGTHLWLDRGGDEAPGRLHRAGHAAARRTVAASRTLAGFGLLQPITIHKAGEGTGGASSALHGLLAVDEAKLNGLTDDALLRLRAEGLLGPVYTHLVSLRAIARLPG